MVRSAVRMLLACVVAFAVLMPVGVAFAQPGQVVAVAQQPTPTGGSGPDIAPAPSEQDAARSRQKLVIGVAAVLLLGVVIFGQRTRRARRKKAAGG